MNKQSLLIISLIAAFLIFYTVDQKTTTLVDNSAEVLYSQPVRAIYNEELYVVEGVPKTADVTLIGRKWDVYLAKQYHADEITLDLQDLKPGTHRVATKYKQQVSSVEYKIDPSIVTVVVYEKMSANRELTYDVIHKDRLDTKLNIESVTLSRDNVIIKGAEYKLAKVASVKALIDFDGILSESKKVELIDKFLTTENIKESNFNKRFDLVKKYVKDLYPGEKTIEEVKKMFRNIISYNVIPESIYEKKREEIKNNIKILNEEFIENENLTLEENNNKRKKLYLEKKKAREKIYNFTVSVGLYDLNKIDSIKWKNEEIEIIKCNYSIEKGFEKIKNIKQKEENFDNFS